MRLPNIKKPINSAEAGATVLLAASVFHFNLIRIPDLKAYLAGRGFAVRPLAV